ncbi:hypothetical protein D3C81_1823060 [compost metagenome]
MDGAQVPCHLRQRGQVSGLGNITGLPVQPLAESRLKLLELSRPPAHRQDPGASLQQAFYNGKADTGAGTGNDGKAILELVLGHEGFLL